MKIKYVFLSGAVVGAIILGFGIKRKVTLPLPTYSVSEENVAKQSIKKPDPAKSEIKAASEPAAIVSVEVSPETFPQIEKANDFRSIQAKVFKSPEELHKIKLISTDATYLDALRKYLTNANAAIKAEFREQQNLAIDILLEGLKYAESSAAESALRAIIKDATIENSELNFPARAALAAVKAEVLYQSSAMRADLFANVEDLLPGPVSKKIWDNVLLKQAENAKESEAERQSYETAKIDK